jgi:carboxyl-terminal processing protease
MTRKRTTLFTALFAAAAIISLAAAPGVVSSTQSLYQRLEVLSRVFEIIEMHYVEDVTAEEMFQYAINGVLENLDPHSRYYTADEYRELTERYRGDYFGIGIQFDIFDGVLTVLDAIEGGPSERLGLRPGDQIVKITGENAIGLDNDQIYERLRGPRGTDVEVTVRRPALDEEWNVNITRDQVEVPAVLAATMLPGQVGYVWLQTFSQKGADQLEQNLREFDSMGMQAFILDLRGNRGGLMNQAIRIVDKFLDGGKKIVYTQGRTPNSNGENYSTDRDTHTRIPMIVLVDHQSASASEIVAGALQDWDRALIVGQLTWGKALVQNQFPFSDGSALFLTIARYYTPSGRLIQRPYTGGDDEEYFNPDWAAIEAQVEGEEVDGKEVEVERPVFTTAAGREVLGGGGIVPDVSVEPGTVSRLAVWAYNRRLTFQYATRFVADRGAEIPADFGDYIRDFEVTDEVLGDFEAFLRSPQVAEMFETDGAPTDQESWTAAHDDFRKYLKSHIAANIWGLEAGRVVLLSYDRQVQEAMNLVEQAASLLALPVTIVDGAPQQPGESGR